MTKRPRGRQEVKTNGQNHGQMFFGDGRCPPGPLASFEDPVGSQTGADATGSWLLCHGQDRGGAGRVSDLGLTMEEPRTKEPSFESQRLDAQAVKDCECSACGHKGLRYRWEPGIEHYHAFAVCPECGNEEEF